MAFSEYMNFKKIRMLQIWKKFNRYRGEMELNIFLRKTKKFMIPKREITSQFFFAVYIILHKVLSVGGLFIPRLLIGHAFYEAPILQKLHRKIILSYFMTWGLKKVNGNVNLNYLGYLEVNKGFHKKKLGLNNFMLSRILS